MNLSAHISTLLTLGKSPNGRGIGRLTRAATLALTLALSVLILVSMPVQAQQSATSQNTTTRDQAAKKALRQHGAGKVLGVRKKTRDDGSAYFEVKILTNGQVSIYQIDV